MLAIDAELRAVLASRPRVLIMGIGSELRADDAAGMLLISLLQQRLAESERLCLVGGSTAPENFTGVIKSFAPEVLLIVDAAHLELQPGEARVVDDAQIGGLDFSTHMLPFPVMLNYLREEVQFTALVVGIQPQSTEMGEPMCPAVENTVHQLADLLAELLA